MIIDTRFNIGDKCFIIFNNIIQEMYVREIVVNYSITFGFPNLPLGSILLKLHHDYKNTYSDSKEWIIINSDKCFKTKEDLIKTL